MQNRFAQNRLTKSRFDQLLQGLKLPLSSLITIQAVLAGVAFVHLVPESARAVPVKAQVQVFDSGITLAEVKSAQQAWCSALLSISKSYYEEGPIVARNKAAQVIDSAYGYAIGPVAFKPTMASAEDTFRPTRDGALNYFVGPDKSFPQGKGFATYRNWKRCTIQDSVVQIFGNTANTMGFVMITDADGVSTTVEKTWTFMKVRRGDIRIVLHHSSAPVTGR